MEKLFYYEGLVDWHKKQISYYDAKLKTDLTETQVECYKKLKIISQKAILECQQKMRKILNGEAGV